MNLYRHYRYYFLISAIFLVPGLISLIFFGFRPGIDFTGGSLLTIKATEASQSALLTEDSLRMVINSDYAVASIKATDDQQVILRLATLDNDQKNQLLTEISQLTPVEQVSFDSVGATMGRELIEKTLIALALASVILIIYLRVRFHNLDYGLAAFLGVVHDTLIICGIFSLLGHFAGVEVDTLFVTAILTTISFSVHDTIVIYDRLRELHQTNTKTDLAAIANQVVLATLSRSLNNSLVVVFMLLSLLLLGGVTLRYFALALLLGVVFGTYSSPFTSVPLLLLFNDWRNRHPQPTVTRKVS